jgi:peptidyl-prolyl cis-trans isomerase B (cyclophilin B)
MSYRNQNQNRRARRENLGAASSTSITDLDLPGPLKLMSNRKLFFALAAFAGFAMVASLLLSALGYGRGSSSSNTPMQAQEAPDIPIAGTTSDSATPEATAAPVVKHYDTAPAMTIDTSKTYTATITTDKGDIQIELYPQSAPQAVNAFVFLAQEGYYDGTQFMELIKAPDGSKFYAQAGDPTDTGLGTPGFSIQKEVSDKPFDTGAVGMGGTANNSNGGQFFISFGDYPALNGKYTIFGQVTSGMDVLNNLNLLDLTTDGVQTPGDTIHSVTISES